MPLCSTCAPAACNFPQVRAAYRRKGWAFTDPQGIEQCAKEGFSKALQDQAGEGCHMWGVLSVNKVSSVHTISCPLILAIKRVQLTLPFYTAAS